MVRFQHQGMKGRLALTCVLIAVLLAGVGLLRSCDNNPWPGKWAGTDTFFTSYVSEIKTLDPAVSYYVHEGEIIDSIMEMPLCYDYLKRPFELVPLLLESIPEPIYYGEDGNVLAGDPPAESVRRVEYLLTLRRGVRYQPHPCFAVDGEGRNLNLSGKRLKHLECIQDFPHQSTREMVASDFKVGLVRLTDRRLASPVYSSLSSFIMGFDECSKAVGEEVSRLEGLTENRGRDKGLHPVLVDYGKIPFAGLTIVDNHHFKLVLSRKYPQVIYWLTMHFFSPVPPEALAFYSDPRVADQGFQMRLWPIGTGPYMMTECKPRERMVLERNPNYRLVTYPTSGEEGDRERGLLKDAGKALPLNDRLVFTYEREPLPVWTKFQQGYYDDSGIPADMFDTAVTVDPGGDLGVGKDMAKRHVRMVTSVQATTYYLAFNMLDKTVGGLSDRQCALRQAISIALDFHEYVDIFSNGRDVAAQSLIPPNCGIVGASKLNPYTDEIDGRGRIQRKSLEVAKELMAQAGYPAGIGRDGRPLQLFFDDASSSNQWKIRYQWMRNKLGALGIDLQSRVTDANRHRDKISSGDWQMMMKAWVADYPDPENFLFLFYGGNGTVKNAGHGMNYCNYDSPEYDRLFKQLETMQDCPKRRKLIDEAVRLLQRHAPWVWAYHRRDLFLVHDWYGNYKPHAIGKNFRSHARIDGRKRLASQRQWNHPMRWPMGVLLGMVGMAGMWLIWRQPNQRRAF